MITLLELIIYLIKKWKMILLLGAVGFVVRIIVSCLVKLNIFYYFTPELDLMFLCSVYYVVVYVKNNKGFFNE